MQLPRLPSRRGLTAEVYQFLADTREFLRSLVPIQSLDVMTSHTAAGVSRKANPIQKSGAPESSPTQAFRIKTVLPDYLVCNKVEFAGVTPVADSTDVNVARSYKLRKTPFDGKTIGGVSYAYATSGTDGTQGRARLATSAGVIESQTIVPAYTNYTGGTYVGDIIYADENPLGGTGVLAANGDSVTWLDQNRDGRAWAEAFN